MSEHDRYIPGVPCWVDTTQPDPQAAVAFYGDLFGWEFTNVMPADAPLPYHVARLRGGDVAAVAGQRGAGAAVWNSYIWVDDADATTARVRAAGGTVLAQPGDVGDAGRMAIFADPDGAAFRVWEAREHRGATVVNEPGSLNFNDLHTPDLERARAFYGGVFGWDLVGTGGGSSAWALPAYGDFLEQRNPGTRERQRAMGAPERFEEVVASVSPITDDRPAHWGVTFAVADADAVAARAVELGGQVVVPPFDAPWVRMTIITDPQGATFTASSFVPQNRATAERAGGAST